MTRLAAVLFLVFYFGNKSKGVFRGDERFQNLSQIYGAVKYVRNGWKGKKATNRIIAEAVKKLNQHDVKNINRSVVKKMNNLFDNHEIWTNPKELGYYNFKIFFIEFIETFFELEKEERVSKRQ